MAVRESIHGQWSTRWAFILAATGSAVGLGNIWKFPYITGENGGGAFVLVYLLCIAVIGIPIMMAEVMLGRRGRQSPINTMETLSIEAGHSTHWKYLGWMGVIGGFLILSYYSVIAGWALAYIRESVSGVFVNSTPDGVKGVFGDLVSKPWKLIGWHTLFMVMTMVVVARGVQGGLEKAVRFLMPALFVILLILVGYASETEYFHKGLEFLFKPDFHALFHVKDANGVEHRSWNAVLTAMGHAFFTLSLGMGAIMVYGSYLPSNTSIMQTSFIIAIADTLVALLAGMAIFPIVFANNLEPGSGPGLIFQTLPLAFGRMDGGILFATLFFILLTFAAWSSSISLIEPAVAWLVENAGMSRIIASVVMGGACWAVGLLTVFSFNIWQDVHLLSGIKIFKDATIFDLLDYLTANIMLPLGGLLIAIFAVWVMSREASMEELDLGNGILYKSWRLLVRYITPVAVIIVFMNVTGVFNWLSSIAWLQALFGGQV
ncbi:MAG: sodium-dependent transporter [Gammaproteobacteria bacterium]|nr:sodium-dependent transporter [Gammaproteobacteria bacterium]MDH5652238.1 sodium-dependent transporter [Gammaproteobacteria bacterium]